MIKIWKGAEALSDFRLASLKKAILAAFAALTLAAAPAWAGSQPQAALDECQGKMLAIHVKGWAYDPDASSQSIGVQVCLYTDSGCASQYGGVRVLAADRPRSDVNSVKGVDGDHGFDATIPVLASGTYWVKVFAIDATGDGNLQISATRSVTVAADTRGRVQLWARGPYWAETNIGADEPWESGYYFWWGDTVGYWRENDTWVASDGSSSNFSFDDVNTLTYGMDDATLLSEGWITAAGVLTPAHDAAQAQWGGAWRMPTYPVFEDLVNNCDWTWTTTNGVNGYVVRGRGDYSAASIFLPAAGLGDENYFGSAGSLGGFWSSVPNVHRPELAGILIFASDVISVDLGCYRFGGLSVRPVQVPAGMVAISFDANGGSLSSSLSSPSYTPGETYGSLPAATREGYTFAGWFTTAGGGTQVTAASTVPASDTMLHAHWTAVQCTVTLDGQGGTGGTESVTASYDSAMPAIAVPTRPGYTFGGYYTGTNGSGTRYYTASGASDRTWDLTDDITLYADWTVNRYTVTLDRQGGTGGTESVIATYDWTIRAIAVPTRLNHTFGGYYTGTNGSGTQYYTASGDASVRTWDLTDATTLYAKWERNASNGHVEVQLWAGGPYWAETNIGADEPWESGYYFWWGDTVGYRRENNAWVASDGSSSDFSFDSGNIPIHRKDIDDLQSEGWITSDFVLVPSHDTAQAQWGGKWRMPTDEDLENLVENCDWTWTTTNGVNGYVVSGRGDFADASIFLPAVGFGSRTSLENAGSKGYCWSSVTYSSAGAMDLSFSAGDFSLDGHYRYFGIPVRPVHTELPGSGTAFHPYRISTVADWNAFAANVNAGVASDAFYCLEADIGPVTNTVGTQDHPFRGTFDGVGHTLSVTLSGTDSFVAPFSVIGGATIRNILVEGTVAGNLHCSGLVGAIVTGTNVIENCEVAAAISTSRTHFGGFVGHGYTSVVTLRGCVFSGSLSGGKYVATFNGWSDDGATTTLIDCFDASESTQPIGRGTDAACVTNTYYLASKDFGIRDRLWSEGKRGQRAYSVTAGEGVTIDFCAPAATYGATGIAAYPTGMARNGTFYAGQGDAVCIDLAATLPPGMAVEFVASAGTLSRSGGVWTLAMPDGPVVVNANMTAAAPRGKVRLWAGGPCWAETNVGADEPWESGYCFWWGDTVGYKWRNNAWVASDLSSSAFSFVSGNIPTYDKDYATLRSEGWIAANGVLTPTHDAAHVHWGEGWRMPTNQELDDLVNNCDWTWTTTNGVNGYVVSGRGVFADASIFLPAAGYGYRITFDGAGSQGNYCTSVPFEGSSVKSWCFYISSYGSGYRNTYEEYRYIGQFVRPVIPETINLSTLAADFTAEDGDVLAGSTKYAVAVPAGAIVTINGVAVTGVGGATVPAPAFAAGGEAVTTKFEQGAGDTWVITAFAELANDAVGADVADEQLKVYRGDTVNGITNAVVPTVTRKSSAVKVEMTVDAPSSAPAQFFRVGFGE